MSELHQAEVLVIGSGIAGAVTAFQLAEQGIPVTVLSRSVSANESATYFAQGGIVFKGKQDSAALLEEDILRAGAGLSYPRAVHMLAERGPTLVKSVLVDKLGVPFDQDPSGAFSLGMEGGHTINRIIHAADATGKAIENTVLDAIRKHPNIQLLEGYTAVDILTPAHHSNNLLSIYQPNICVGVYALHRETNRIVRVLARKTILASGGLGQIFKRTTNPAGARGDGLAMAYRAGARVINNEFIQFHPTTYYHEYKQTFLISEAVRGAGARLVNSDGKPFMQNYDARWKDLAPRDIVAISIHKEMLLRDVSNVYLDMASYMSRDQIENEFPNIYRKCRENGIDPTRQPIPVVPAAHYACGGVWVDLKARTTIRNLYAAGEVSATGVHGANRLASTSLLEGLVWGCAAADDITQTLMDTPKPEADEIQEWEDSGSELPDPALISQDMSSIKNIMWNYVGLVRTSVRLQRALRELRNLENEIERFYRVSKLTDGLVGLRNAVRTAIIVTAEAWENKNSIGCHYRE